MVVWLIFACCLALLIVTGGLARVCLLVVTIDSGSMMPTFYPGDRVLALRRWPGMRLRKGQIVVFWLPGSQPRTSGSRPYIKRIMGCGGEVLTESMLANGEVGEQNRLSNPRERHWTVAGKHIFVCGDNRDASSDSREWGTVPERNVIAVVVKKLARTAYAAPPLSLPVDLLDRGLAAGQKAPPFTAQTLEGKAVALATYQGRSVLFLFFAPAEHCRHAIALCSNLATRMAERGVTIICISGATWGSTRRFAKEIQLRLPVLVAPRSRNTFFRDYHVAATPAFCLLDGQSVIQSAGHLSMKDESWKTLYEQWTSSRDKLPEGLL